jgi:hypothetical protein
MAAVLFLSAKHAHFREKLLTNLKYILPNIIVSESSETALAELANQSNTGSPLLITDCTQVDFLQKLATIQNITAILSMDSMEVSKNLPPEVLSLLQAFVLFPENSHISTLLLPTIKNIQAGGKFGLQHHFEETIVAHRATLSRGSDKLNIIQSLENQINHNAFASQHPSHRMLALRASEVLDELLMNAVFHAIPRFAEERAHLHFDLEPTECIEVAWAFGENSLALSVSDPFGSLDKQALWRHVSNAKPTQPISLRKSAGLGLRMIFQRAEQMIVTVAPGIRTEVTCFFPFEEKVRAHKDRGRSLLYLTIPTHDGDAHNTNMDAQKNRRFSMDINISSHCIRLRGVLNEDVTQMQFEQTLSAAFASIKGRLTVDFSEVSRTNSCGIARWISAVSNKNYPLNYTSVPIWLLEQFLMIEEFSSGDMYIDSLILPFYCVDSDVDIQKCLAIGKEIPLLNDYSNFSFDFLDQDGRQFVVNFDADALFDLLISKHKHWITIAHAKQS